MVVNILSDRSTETTRMTFVVEIESAEQPDRPIRRITAVPTGPCESTERYRSRGSFDLVGLDQVTYDGNQRIQRMAGIIAHRVEQAI